MNRRVLVPVVLAVLLAIMSSTPAEGQRAKRKPAPAQPAAKVPPAWTGLSARALVAHPTKIPGVEGWTIESRRHRGGLMCLSPSPDAKQLVTGGLDGTVRVWNVQSGLCERALVGHDSYVYSLAWSPNGNVVASAGTHDGTVRLWDVQDGKPLKVYRGLKDWVYHVAWAPDGNTLVASGGLSGWFWVSTGAGDGSVVLEFGQPLYNMAFSPDSSQVVVCGRQLPVSIVDMATRKTKRTLGAVEESFMVAAWSPDGSLLAAGGASGIKVWDCKEQEEKVTAKIPGVFGSVAWSPDGKYLVTATTGGLVQLWDAASAKLVGPLPALGTKVLWHPKAEQIFVMSSLGFSVVDPSTKKQIQSVDAAGLPPPIWTAGRPIVSGLGTTKLSLWDANTLKFLCELKGHTAPVSAIAWSRDGNTLASGGQDKTVRLWNGKSGELLETLSEHKAAISTLAWSSDGKNLASAGLDKNVIVWTARGEYQGKLERHTAPVTALAWSRAGSLLASGSSDGSIVLWDTDKMSRSRIIQAFQPVYSLAWTSAGRTSALACGTVDDSVRVYNAATGVQLGNLYQPTSPPGIPSVAWLPNATMLLSGRSSHIVQLWDIAERKVIHSLPAMAPVQYVTWGINGSLLAAGNNERTVRFWDATSGQCRGVLLEEKDCVAMIAADGSWRWDPDKKNDLIFVVETEGAQLTMTPEAFSERFGIKSKSMRAKPVARN